MNRPARVFISVAEDSADIHAAALVRTARRLLPDCAFYGLTGPRLRALGVKTVFDLTTHAAMLSGIVGVIGHAYRALNAVRDAWKRQPPDLVILLDSPEFNLRLARQAHRRGYRVLYYIAPQTWASRAGRNPQIARDVDRLACILPFEQDYFRNQLVYADYVGHPLFETLADESADPEVVKRLRAGGKPVVAILPGSRQHVIDAMLPLQLEVVRRLRSDGMVVQPVVSCVAPDRVPLIRRHIIGSGHAAEMIVADNASLLEAADMVLVSSGTATLQVAYYRKPMVVMYDAGGALRIPYRLLGRYLLKLPHLSLVNILGRARVVPEFMPFVTDLAAVAKVTHQLLTDTTWRALMCRQLDEIVSPLQKSTASENVCRMMQTMLADRIANTADSA